MVVIAIIPSVIATITVACTIPIVARSFVASIISTAARTSLALLACLITLVPSIVVLFITLVELN